MTLFQTIQVDLGKVAHAFVVGAAKVKAAVIWAAGQEPKIAAEVAAVEAVANSLINQVYPGADVVAVAIEGVFGHILDAVEKAGPAAGANGMDVTLDTALVNAVKAALPIVKAQAQTTPGS